MACGPHVRLRIGLLALLLGAHSISDGDSLTALATAFVFFLPGGPSFAQADGVVAQAPDSSLVHGGRAGLIRSLPLAGERYSPFLYFRF